MGITGLIPFLEKASSKVHLKDLRGSTVAVDTYCWLHKGVFCCAEKLVRGEETDLYIQYCLKYVHLLLSYNIKPILVFDGRHLPAKALTEKRRRESRQQSKKRAAELLRLGQIEEARSHMRRCIDVTHEMALRLIRECRERNVDCIVAPYEADAQMAWLNKVDLAQYVITEDSDLTLFGARKVIFKLDLTGAGLLVESDKLYLAMGCRQERFTFEKFRRMCILSGCDYLDSLPGIGLAKACKFMLKTEETDMWRALKKIPQYLNMRNLEVDDEYIENFLKAEATFKHMFIYNPLKRKMERLYELNEFETDERFCSNAGKLLEDDEQAFQLALGNLNPFNLKQLDIWHPNNISQLEKTAPKNSVKRSKHKSIWLENYKPHTKTININKFDPSESTSYGIYFKKVDFINKNSEANLDTSLKEEESKPAEEEIFSMYKNEGTENIGAQLNFKRKRSSSISSNKTIPTETPPLSPVVTRTRCNPFAKAVENTLVSSSSDICKNSSLLKMFSPKKHDATQENLHFLTSVSSVKRSILGNAEKFVETTKNVEVKSRFFAANVRQVTQMQSIQPHFQPHEKMSEDLTNEINRIERLSQQTEDNQLLLYNHCTPSPKKLKTQINNEIQEAHKVSEDNQIAEENLDRLSETQVLCSQGSSSQRSQQTNITDSIVLSDDNDDDFDHETVKISKNKPLETCKFNSKRAPRLGLSNPKKTIAKNKSISKKSSNSVQQGANQTRLSMFGFQKRPALK